MATFFKRMARAANKRADKRFERNPVKRLVATGEDDRDAENVVHATVVLPSPSSETLRGRMRQAFLESYVPVLRANQPSSSSSSSSLLSGLWLVEWPGGIVHLSGGGATATMTTSNVQIPGVPRRLRVKCGDGTEGTATTLEPNYRAIYTGVVPYKRWKRKQQGGGMDRDAFTASIHYPKDIVINPVELGGGEDGGVGRSSDYRPQLDLQYDDDDGNNKDASRRRMLVLDGRFDLELSDVHSEHSFFVVSRWILYDTEADARRALDAIRAAQGERRMPSFDLHPAEAITADVPPLPWDAYTATTTTTPPTTSTPYDALLYTSAPDVLRVGVVAAVATAGATTDGLASLRVVKGQQIMFDEVLKGISRVAATVFGPSRLRNRMCEQWQETIPTRFPRAAAGGDDDDGGDDDGGADSVWSLNGDDSDDNDNDSVIVLDSDDDDTNAAIALAAGHYGNDGGDGNDEDASSWVFVENAAAAEFPDANTLIDGLDLVNGNLVKALAIDGRQPWCCDWVVERNAWRAARVTGTSEQKRRATTAGRRALEPGPGYEVFDGLDVTRADAPKTMVVWINAGDPATATATGPVQTVTLYTGRMALRAEGATFGSHQISYDVPPCHYLAFDGRVPYLVNNKQRERPDGGGAPPQQEEQAVVSYGAELVLHAHPRRTAAATSSTDSSKYATLVSTTWDPHRTMAGVDKLSSQAFAIPVQAGGGYGSIVAAEEKRQAGKRKGGGDGDGGGGEGRQKKKRRV